MIFIPPFDHYFVRFRNIFMHPFRIADLLSGRVFIAVLWISLGACFFLQGCGFVRTFISEDNGLKTVLFTYVGKFNSVCISGDFNAWSSDSHCLVSEGDVWTIEVSLMPGSYRYGYIIDGKKWKPDPKAFLHEVDGFGKTNSVMIVE